MKIIVDKYRQLNYHPLVVYFMLQPKDYAKYAKEIERLNRYNGFTRGIFKFKAIARGNEYSYDLRNELRSIIRNFNVIVRLVDDNEGNYNYALGKMIFSKDPLLFEQSMQRFIIDVCNQNIRNLKSRSLYYSGHSDESIENTKMHSEMALMFKKAINIKGFKRGVWGDDMNLPTITACKSAPSSFGRSLPDCSLGHQLPPEIAGIKRSIYNSLTDEKAKSDFKRMMEFFEASMDVPDIKESDSYVQGTIDNSRSKKLSIDYKSRVKQGERPDITIAIDKIAVENNKRVWGVEIRIDDMPIPIYIGSTAAKMVYICTLLRQKMGTYLFREAFKRPLPDKCSAIKRHPDVLWLEKVYKTLIPGAITDFDIWYPNMKNDSCRFINQGKSETARVIKTYLEDFNDAVYYCCIQKGVNDLKQTYYYIDIPTECIHIPEELEFLISDSAESTQKE